jgi:hypothetical protein
MLDGAVLAGRVESLQDQEHAVRVLRGEPVLILGEEIHAVGEQVGGLLMGHLAGIARIVITAQPDGAAGGTMSGSMRSVMKRRRLSIHLRCP